jgi:hypothetical protein
MPSITMADIQAAADEQYGPLTLDDIPGGVIRLLPLIRLSKAKRDEIVALSDKSPAKTPAKKAAARSGSPAKRAASKAPTVREGLEVVGRLERMLELTAETPEQGSRLIAHFDGDIAKLQFVFEKWNERQQAGEASPSST